MTCIQWKDLEVKLKDHTKHPEQWALELTTRRQSLAGDSGSLWSQALRFSSRLLAPGRRCELCQPQLSHLQQSSLWGLPPKFFAQRTRKGDLRSPENDGKVIKSREVKRAIQRSSLVCAHVTQNLNRILSPVLSPRTWKTKFRVEHT